MATFIVLTALLFSTSFWFWLVRRTDRFAPEPFWFLAKIMLLGGMISIIPTSFLNSFVLYLYRYNAKKITSMLLHSPLRPIGHCPVCKTNSSKNSRICRRCGGALFPAEEFPLLKKKICKNCARQNVFSVKFCVQCGTKG